MDPLTRMVYEAVDDQRLLRRYLLARSHAAPGIRTLIQAHGRQWVAFLAARNRSLLTADAEDAAALMLEWDKMHWSARSRRRGIRVLRTMHAWLAKSVGAPHNPWAQAHGPRKRRTIPRILDDDQWGALVGALARTNIRDLRDRAMVWLFVTGGVGSSELRDLNLGNLDMPNRSAIIPGEYKKERRVFFTAEAADALCRWLAVGRPAWARHPGMGAVFLDRYGGRIGLTAIRNALMRAQRGAQNRARLAKRLKPHGLRPTWAPDMIQGGVEVGSVRQLLGHAETGTTRVCPHVPPERLRQEYMRVAQGETPPAEHQRSS